MTFDECLSALREGKHQLLIIGYPVSDQDLRLHNILEAADWDVTPCRRPYTEAIRAVLDAPARGIYAVYRTSNGALHDIVMYRDDCLLHVVNAAQERAILSLHLFENSNWFLCDKYTFIKRQA